MASSVGTVGIFPERLIGPQWDAVCLVAEPYFVIVY